MLSSLVAGIWIRLVIYFVFLSGWAEKENKFQRQARGSPLFHCLSVCLVFRYFNLRESHFASLPYG